MKENILKMKRDIKKLAGEQRQAKSNRKTKYFKGKRIMDPQEAVWKAMSNKWILRHMYLAYGKLRGREFSEIEVKAKTDFDKRYVEKLMNDYGTEVICTDS